MHDHFVTAGAAYNQRVEHFRPTGEWPPRVVDPSMLAAERPPVYASHLVARVSNAELSELVQGCLEAFGEATISATSADETRHSMDRAFLLYDQVRTHIAVMLARIP